MSIYRQRPNLTIGFHGCDETVRGKLVSDPDTIRISREKYDWLGHGFYVWENNYTRAWQWACEKQKRTSNFTPSVIGVVYQLEYCLDFTDSEFIDRLVIAHQLLKLDMLSKNQELPKNKNLPGDQNNDMVLRELDCTVIEYLHRSIEENMQEEIATKGFTSLKPFDTVRGSFSEGGPVFEGSGIHAKSHIQVCIRNMNCIKGFFIPRKEIKFS